MIAFKLRQEKHGGYLLDRRRGAATALPQPAFALLRELHAAGAPAPGWPADAIARHFAGDPGAGQRWWQTFDRLGLTDADGLATLQLIPLDVEPADLPDDCLAAPARIYFELTRRCNLACRTCFNGSHRPLSDELTTAEIYDLLDQLSALGTFEIRFTGGEPTEHPHFRAILAHARALGLYISLGSNGVYSDEKREWIYDSGVDWFIVSLDGPPAVNDRVRGAGTYAQVERTLADLQRRGIRARLNAVVARHNVGEIEHLCTLAERYDVEALNLIPLRPYGRSRRTMLPDMFDRSDFYGFIRLIAELRRRHAVQLITTLDLLDPSATTSHDLLVAKQRSCAAGIEAAVIGPTGDFYGCSYSPASFPDSSDSAGRAMFVAGSLRRESARAIWRDSRRWAVFRYLETYKNPRCHTCGHYGVRCVGACPIMGYFEQGQPEAFDPYCFVDLLPACVGALTTEGASL